MFNSTRLKYAIQTLRELSKERGELSRHLSGLKSRCQLRENIVDNLYDYYDIVSGDYYAAVDGLVKTPEAIEVLRDYMQEHYGLLEDQMEKMRAFLDQPVKPVETLEKLEKMRNFVFYMKEPPQVPGNSSSTTQ